MVREPLQVVVQGMQLLLWQCWGFHSERHYSIRYESKLWYWTTLSAWCSKRMRINRRVVVQMGRFNIWCNLHHHILCHLKHAQDAFRQYKTVGFHIGNVVLIRGCDGHLIVLRNCTAWLFHFERLQDVQGNFVHTLQISTSGMCARLHVQDTTEYLDAAILRLVRIVVWMRQAVQILGDQLVVSGSWAWFFLDCNSSTGTISSIRRPLRLMLLSSRHFFSLILQFQLLLSLPLARLFLHHGRQRIQINIIMVVVAAMSECLVTALSTTVVVAVNWVRRDPPPPSAVGIARKDCHIAVVATQSFE
jgi:hypothetical protein